jgi:3-hydroxyisobutyrate dehydrogenase
MTEAADAHRLAGGELTRMAKLCHNLLPGAVAAPRAEINIVAQATGISPEAFLASQNKSLVGSAFTRYKSPAHVDLTSEPTFTSKLLIQGVIGWLR